MHTGALEVPEEASGEKCAQKAAWPAGQGRAGQVPALPRDKALRVLCGTPLLTPRGHPGHPASEGGARGSQQRAVTSLFSE